MKTLFNNMKAITMSDAVIFLALTAPMFTALIASYLNSPKP